MDVKSHIQITKKLLFYFSHKDFDEKGEGSFVYFLNLYNFEIGNKRINDFGTSLGYYSKDIENILNKQYENGFGSFIKKIIMGNAEINKITHLEMNSAAKFAFSSRFRKQQLHDDLIDHFAKKGERIDTSNIIQSIELIPNDIKCDYLVLLRNKTCKNYVAPFNCLMNVRNFYGLDYVLPISPKIALGFANLNYPKSGCCEISVTEKDVEILNFCAFNTEKLNIGLIVSIDKETLIDLIKYREESQNGHVKFQA